MVSLKSELMHERQTLNACLSSLLGAPLQGMHVIQAPPGLGKSKAAMLALAQALREGRYTRVLWAVKDLAQDCSLGQEALRKLQETLQDQGASAEVTLVVGQHIARKQKLKPVERAARFAWPAGTPAIKVISHARLSRVFGPPSSEEDLLLRTVDLIVIDEDPRTSLLRSSPVNDAGTERQYQPVRVTRQALRDLDALGSISSRLLALMEQVEQGAALPGVRTYAALPGRTRERYSLCGEAFFRAVLEGADDSDWNLFIQTLEELAQKQKRQAPLPWVTALLRQQSPDSHALGIEWTQGQEDECSLRYDVKPDVSFPSPVIVLDAYANREAYALTFPNADLTWHGFQPPTPLKVRVSSALRMDARDEGSSGRQPRRQAHRQRIVREAIRVIQQDPQRRPVLLLASKAVASGHLRALARKELTAADLAEDRIAFAHWHAGRGVNAYEGYHLFALEQPHLPRRHEDHTLAALAPTDADARARLYAHDLRSECLQMLHRTRQPFAEHAPLIVAGFDVQAVLGADHVKDVQVEAFTPQIEYTRNSKNPSARQALQEILPELLNRLDGVPLASLQALGLVKATSPDLTRRAASQLKRLARSSTPLLHDWKLRGSLSRHELVHPLARIPDDYLKRLEQERGLRRFHVTLPHARYPLRHHPVLAVSQQAAEAACKKLLHRS
ncbi:hypothetical protein [Deinococcus aquaedulcis]|uniref:hypothetical protein n=1 Tax=Deinococcus aquaedulcis TaxID=2840455 RepID=UPI001C829D93|nr:hypothetical protein [Deinococcus aquaedulcis]